MVPQSSFWLYDGETPVGYGRIRHNLNDALRANGGHIGYAIAKTKRGQGYGNSILALLKAKCVELGIRQIQIAARIENERSNRVIRHNGGVLFKQNSVNNFYHIDLTE